MKEVVYMSWILAGIVILYIHYVKSKSNKIIKRGREWDWMDNIKKKNK